MNEEVRRDANEMMKIADKFLEMTPQERRDYCNTLNEIAVARGGQVPFPPETIEYLCRDRKNKSG